MAHRILALDGGGSWALLEALALQAIYGDMPGHDILKEFDLAVANSGGSIVLGGLVENKTPAQILTLFSETENREAIFARLPPLRHMLSRLPIFPRYASAGKLRGLQKVFKAQGLQSMSELKGVVKNHHGREVRILIVSFDYDAQRAVFFRNYGTRHGAKADKIPLVDAVHASSNAPVSFFDAPTHWGGRRYWDGAMSGLNNPLMAGLIDLLAQGVPAADIAVLTIGTGTIKLAPAAAEPPAPAALSEAPEPSTLFNDLGKAGGCLTDDPPDTATFSAHVILSAARNADVTQVGQVVRLSPVVQPVLTGDGWHLPEGLDPTLFATLTKLQMDAVADDAVKALMDMGHAWIKGGVPNQAIRMRSDTLQATLGEDVFRDAVDRWRRLCAQGGPAGQ